APTTTTRSTPAYLAGSKVKLPFLSWTVTTSGTGLPRVGCATHVSFPGGSKTFTASSPQSTVYGWPPFCETSGPIARSSVAIGTTAWSVDTVKCPPAARCTLIRTGSPSTVSEQYPGLSDRGSSVAGQVAGPTRRPPNVRGSWS